ncbi:DUF1064 domain-containing protein [Burkholderia vietnamiensis]|uniref:DUF1064 domain-containing protein n=1 Tax=Burkholderia vietnamiensis TaxID=60552 RepID=UPI00352D738A
MSKAIRFPDGSVVDGRIGTARIRSQISGASAQLAALGAVPLDAALSQLVGSPERRSKYGNRKVVVDGITFDSEREGARYSTLARMRAAGEITQLQIQVPFEIVPAAVVGGRKRPARTYIADFVYRDAGGALVVEDVKGVRTPVYTMKRHLMKVVHNIDIVEV